MSEKLRDDMLQTIACLAGKHYVRIVTTDKRRVGLFKAAMARYGAEGEVVVLPPKPGVKIVFDDSSSGR
jgi:hypothetical protein